jgi:hypothetical protein
MSLKMGASIRAGEESKLPSKTKEKLKFCDLDWLDHLHFCRFL